MTGRDLISASLRLIGAIASGESLDAAEASDGLSAFNRMLDSWSTEPLVIYTKTEEEFVLTPGTQTYTMGPTGTFSTTRPLEIEKAYLKITSQSPAIELPMAVLTVDEWARITIKALSATYPLYLYAEGTYPNETLHIHPNPTAANSLVLYSRKPLTTLTSIDTVLPLPPGYERALIYNFAVEVAPEYGKQVSDPVMMIAQDSKATIKRANSKPKLLRVDSALTAEPRGFNWFTGEPT